MKLPTYLYAALAAMLWPGIAGAGFGAGAAAFSLQNYDKAFTEWRPLAENGDPRAQYHLAILYTNGLGAPRDREQALYWHRLAAAQGHAGAAYKVAAMTDPGDAAEAARWYRFAAERGHAKAQYSLAAMLVSGRGLDRDLVHARKWLVLAGSRLNDKVHVVNARRSLELVTAHMTPDEIAKANHLASEWRSPEE